MKTKWAIVLVTASMCATPLVFGQDASSKEGKSAGTEMKDAGKTVAKDTEKGAKVAGKDVDAAGIEICERRFAAGQAQ